MVVCAVVVRGQQAVMVGICSLTTRRRRAEQLAVHMAMSVDRAGALSDGVHMLTGGGTPLGQLSAQFLVEHGARNLVLAAEGASISPAWLAPRGGADSLRPPAATRTAGADDVLVHHIAINTFTSTSAIARINNTATRARAIANATTTSTRARVIANATTTAYQMR